jgi:hypothetical protein
MSQPWRNATVTPMPARSAPAKVRAQYQAELASQAELARVMAQMEPGESCAYNHTRECFLGVHVVAGDFTPGSFQDWMFTLKPNSGTGMWLAPFRGLPVSDTSAPLDLLYLDQACKVIEVVEFFPTYRVSPGSPPAASVLALPAHSVFATQTQAGDQLILCPEDEIEWRVERMIRTEALAAAAASALPISSLRPVLVREEAKSAPRPVVFSEPPPVEVDSVSIPAVKPEPDAAAVVREVQPAPLPPAPPVQPVPPAVQFAGPQTAPQKPWLDPSRQPAKKPLGKLGRWLFSDPADPRSNSRKPVPGLVAHFFTGGAPQAHEVRDVSATGLYVVTTERWYPGTVIRMTLSKPDIGQSPAERSITVQAQSVRWGNDGVGLRFVVEAPRKPVSRQPSPLDPIDSRQLGEFLKRIGQSVE